MNILKEMLSLLTGISDNYKRFIGSSAFKKSDSYKLIRMVKSGKLNTRKEAKEKLFRKETNKNSLFSQLFNRTISTIAGNLFLKPTEDKTDYKTVYLECVKKVAVVKMLVVEDKLESATYITQRTLAKAKKYQMTEFCEELAYQLMLTARLLGDNKYSQSYEHEYKRYSRVHKAEKRALSYFYKVALMASKYKKPKGENYDAIIDLLDKIIAIKSSSYLLIYRKLRARSIKAQFKNDHQEAYLVLKKTTDYFQSLKFTPPNGHLFNILNKINPSLIITARYPEAKSNIERCLVLNQEGGHNWHITLMYRAILGFHSGDYQLAKSSIQLALKHNKGIAKYIAEWWKLAEAYLYFIGLLGLVFYESSFRPAKFLNEVPIGSKDKGGANVSILVIGQFLIQLARGNRDPFFDKNESMRVYVHNYLKDETNQRCRIFINMLRQLPNCGFDEIKFVEATAGDYARLLATPAKIEDLETEIIPYEELYDMLCGMLAPEPHHAI